MNLYQLSRRKIDVVGYDEYAGHIVRAKTPHEARHLCPHADEGDIWKDAGQTLLKRIGHTHSKGAAPRVLLSDFRAG